jgi:hypothetical protein
MERCEQIERQQNQPTFILDATVADDQEDSTRDKSEILGSNIKMRHKGPQLTHSSSTDPVRILFIFSTFSFNQYYISLFARMTL